jgi:hypothetical protein
LRDHLKRLAAVQFRPLATTIFLFWKSLFVLSEYFRAQEDLHGAMEIGNGKSANRVIVKRSLNSPEVGFWEVAVQNFRIVGRTNRRLTGLFEVIGQKPEHRAND